MSLVREQADLPVAPADAEGEEDDSVLVEDYLAGVPLTVGLLDCLEAQSLCSPAGDRSLTEDGQPYVLEVNSTPVMSRDSNFVVGAAMLGLTHTDVVVAMLHEALVRPPAMRCSPAHSSVLRHPLTREAVISP
ncbi:hypothetical protein AB0H69_46350 [Streptomyces phaeochromogenes]